MAQIEDNWAFQSLGHGCRADRPAWLVAAGIRPFDSAPGQRAGRYALDSGIGMDGEPCGRNTSSAMLHLTRHTVCLDGDEISGSPHQFSTVIAVLGEAA